METKRLIRDEEKTEFVKPKFLKNIALPFTQITNMHKIKIRQMYECSPSTS